MKVKFHQNRVVDDFRRGTKDEERFEAGKTYDLPETSALRWVNRGIADRVADLAKKELPAEPAKVVAKD